jgi:2-dehydro-3-deoxyphosphogluconate aldolase/(4S)-4-hydroxy-2-oxoglutarate aldolase
LETAEGKIAMTRQEVRTRIREVGIVPSIRVSTAEDALFAAEAVAEGGIPIVEIPLTVPGAMEVISHVVHHGSEILVGAGGVSDIETARQCVDAGAQFITSDALDPQIVLFAAEQGLVVFPGVLTPTEISAAQALKPDFVKIVPCGQLGGESYIRALKSMFPDVHMIAAGGVNQKNAFDLIRAGAVALGVGGELIPREAVKRKQADRIIELAGRFLQSVRNSRAQFSAQA